MGWTVRGSNPGGGEIFRIHPDRPWGPPSLLYNGYRVSFPGIMRPGRGVDHPPSSSARVKERVELYLYSPSGSSWPVLGRTLPLPYLPHIFHFIIHYPPIMQLCKTCVPLVCKWRTSLAGTCCQVSEPFISSCLPFILSNTTSEFDSALLQIHKFVANRQQFVNLFNSLWFTYKMKSISL
jgi:hypothetical protein